MVRVVVTYTRSPGGTVYAEPAWWVHTEGRQPDVVLAGPFRTKAEALAARQRHICVHRTGRGYVMWE